MTVRWRITHCWQPRWALWLENTVKLYLRSLFWLKQIAGTQSPLVVGYVNAFEKLGPCSPARWLASKGGDNCGCWHKCAFTGAKFIAVKEVRAQKKCTKCHPRCDKSDSSGVVMSVTQNRGGWTQKMPPCVPMSEPTLSLERCPLCVQVASPSHTSWWRTCWGKEAPAITMRHPGLVLQLEAGRDFTDLCIYMKKPNLPYMAHPIYALQEGQSPGPRVACGEVWVYHWCPGWPS